MPTIGKIHLEKWLCLGWNGTSMVRNILESYKVYRCNIKKVKLKFFGFGRVLETVFLVFTSTRQGFSFKRLAMKRRLP